MVSNQWIDALQEVLYKSLVSAPVVNLRFSLFLAFAFHISISYQRMGSGKPMRQHAEVSKQSFGEHPLTFEQLSKKQ